MAAYLTAVYRVSKKDDFASLAQRVLEAVQLAGGEPRVRFRFADAPDGLGSIGGIQRLLKAYPQFAACRADSEVSDFGSALPPLEAQTLIEIARGVPRRFGFHQAGLFFEADIFDQAPGEKPVLEGARVRGFRELQRFVATPGIIVTSNWWTPRRMYALTATVKLREPGRMPSELRLLLDRLGEKHSEDEFVLPSSQTDATASAERSARADEAFERGKAAFRERLSTLAIRPLIEHGLPAPGESLALREHAGKALRPLGYKSVASHLTGILRFVKTVAPNRELHLEIDRGTWSKSCIAFVELQTPQWSRKSPLPLSSDGAVQQYPLLNELQVSRIAWNLAAILESFEQTVCPPVWDALDESGK